MGARLRLFLAVMFFSAAAIAWPPWGNRTGWNPVDSWHGDLDRGDPIFDLNFADGSGPSKLSNSLSLNGTSMTLVASYDARDAADTWSAVSGGTGPVLTRTAGTTTLKRTPIFTEAASRRATVSTNSVRYNSAGGADVTTGNIGAAEDFVIEVVGCMSISGSASYLAAKDEGGGLGGSGGWWIGMTSIFDLKVADGTTTRSWTVSSPAAVAGACYHVMIFGDHDQATASQSLVAIINGLSTAANGALSTLGAIGGTNYSLTLANLTGGNYGATDGGPVAMRMWKCNACMAGGATNPTQWAAVAEERLHRLAGTYVDIAGGQAYPSTFTRASSASVGDTDLDGDGIRRIARVGAGWPRVIRSPDAGAALRTGFLGEVQRTNLTLRSEEQDNASWTKTQCAASANATAAPDDFTTADALESTDAAGSVEHYIRQAQTLTAASYTSSGWFKVGGDSATHGWIRDNTVANAIAWIRLSDCTIGTVGAGATNVEAASYGNGWCRLAIRYTGTAAAHDIDYGYSNADNVTAYDDGTDSTADAYVWGTQTELGTGVSSYIPTTTATATRAQDILQYSPTSNVNSTIGTSEIQVFCRGGTTGAARLFYVSDSATNSFGFPNTGGSAENFAYVTAGVAQAAIGTGLASINDSVFRTLRASWDTNDVRAWFNGAADGTDTSVTTYADGTATRIAVLNNGAASSAALNTCIMTRARVWNKLVLP